MKFSSDPYKHPPKSYKLKSSSEIFKRNTRCMYKYPKEILATKKVDKMARSAPDLVLGSRSKMAGWSSHGGEKARRSSGWRRAGRRGGGAPAVRVEVRRPSGRAGWRRADRPGGGAPAVGVERGGGAPVVGVETHRSSG
jgi:hypothetical protein